MICPDIFMFITVMFIVPFFSRNCKSESLFSITIQRHMSCNVFSYPKSLRNSWILAKYMFSYSIRSKYVYLL